MAKKKGKKKAAAKKSGPSPVVCFFFYGSMDELGDQLVKFADESQLAAEIVESISKMGATVAVK